MDEGEDGSSAGLLVLEDTWLVLMYIPRPAIEATGFCSEYMLQLARELGGVSYELKQVYACFPAAWFVKQRVPMPYPRSFPQDAGTKNIR